MNENANVFETSRKKTIRIICESVYKNNLKDFWWIFIQLFPTKPQQDCVYHFNWISVSLSQNVGLVEELWIF